MQTGLNLIFTPNACILQDPKREILTVLGEQYSGLYYVKNKPKQAVRERPVAAPILKHRRPPPIPHSLLSSNDIWHFRLGHLSYKALNKVIPFCNSDKKIRVCQVCPRAKQQCLPFAVSSTKTCACFQLIHVDIWGPYRHETYNGYRYFLSIVDDYSRATWVHLISHKSNAFTMLQAFINLVETQFETKVKCIRSDNGMEFSDTNAAQYYKDKGIIHQLSCVERQQQNGVVERKHKHLLEVARALMLQSNLPEEFWGESVLTAAYLINPFPTPILNYKTPYELLYHKVPT